MTEKAPHSGVIRNGAIWIGARTFLVDMQITGNSITSIQRSGLIKQDSGWKYDAQGQTILPGLIDPHVHMQLDVGSHISADTFASGSRAAAFGGITLLMDFSDVVTEGEDQLFFFLQRRRKETIDSVLPVVLHLAVAEPKISPERLVEIAIQEGIKGIKIFTTYKDSGRMTGTGYLHELLRAAARKNRLVLIHAENDDLISHQRKTLEGEPIPVSKLPYLRPVISESVEVMKIAHLVEKTEASVYFVHISSGATVEELHRKYGHLLGRRIFIETCPQYLLLDQDAYQTESGFLFAMCPPLRAVEDQDLLLKHLAEKRIHTVGTDHCPFLSVEKEKGASDLTKMVYGIAGVELSFSLVFSRLKPILKDETLDRCSKIFSSQTAKIFGQYPLRGKITPGAPANLTFFDPGKKWTIHSKELHMNTDYSPYEGFPLEGKVVSTMVDGRFLVKNEQWVEDGS